MTLSASHLHSDLGNPERWLDEHGDALYGFAMARVGDAEKAEDLVQETLLAALRDAARFEGRSSPRTWLIGILKHKILDVHRRQAVSAAEVLPEQVIDQMFTRRGKWRASVSPWGRAPEALLEDGEFREALKGCLARLPLRALEALLMVERQEAGPERVGKVLGMTTTNVSVTLYRARASLRECLERHWFRGHSGSR